MDSKDAVKILEACKGLGLKSLTLGDLKLTFHENYPDLTSGFNVENNNSTRVVPLLKPEDEQSSQENTEYMEGFLNANLMADDPVRFEEELLRES